MLPSWHKVYDSFVSYSGRIEKEKIELIDVNSFIVFYSFPLGILCQLQ